MALQSSSTTTNGMILFFEVVHHSNLLNLCCVILPYTVKWFNRFHKVKILSKRKSFPNRAILGSNHGFSDIAENPPVSTKQCKTNEEKYKRYIEKYSFRLLCLCPLRCFNKIFQQIRIRQIFRRMIKRCGRFFHVWILGNHCTEDGKTRCCL